MYKGPPVIPLCRLDADEEECWKCRSARRGRRVFRGHLDARLGVNHVHNGSEQWRYVNMLMRSTPGAPPVTVAASAAGGKFSEQFPLVHEHLTQVLWEDKTERTTSTILVFFEDGIFKVCFHDRAAGRTAWSSGATMFDALKALEKGLDAGTTEWRGSKVVKRK